jgi:ribonuclease HII
MSPFFDLSSHPDFLIEKELHAEGYRLIAGIDEAGRGALAGPLSLGMVIYNPSIYADTPDDIQNYITDSKKLTPKKRMDALSLIKNYSFLYSSVFVPHTVIDSTNINKATEIGIHKLLAKSHIKPDVIIMDGNFRFKFDIPFISVIKGDNRSITIASASITAKVYRDIIMEKMDNKYPGYGFSCNKGYGTRNHMESLMDKGISEVHRKSYEPVKSMIKGQKLLFNEDNR